jgi:hypothetical protein
MVTTMNHRAMVHRRTLLAGLFFLLLVFPAMTQAQKENEEKEEEDEDTAEFAFNLFSDVAPYVYLLKILSQRLQTNVKSTVGS